MIMELSLKYSRFVVFVWIVGIIFADEIEARMTVGPGSSADTSYFFYQQSDYPRDCQEVHEQCSSGNTSGVYYIKPEGYPEPFEVFCDNNDDSGGWTVIQTRLQNGPIKFKRNWESYEHGFGFVTQDYWLGNDRLSFLTNQKNYELLIEMTTSSGTTHAISYNNFRIGDAHDDYRLIGLAQNSIQNGHISWCPNDLHFGDCACGKRTCEDPETCINTCVVGQLDHCVPCPEGFFMDRGDCVPQEECGCYVEEERKVVPEGEIYMHPGCTRKDRCSNGEITLVRNSPCSTHATCVEKKTSRCRCGVGYTGNGEICRSIDTTRDCQDLYTAGIRDNGVYTIKPTNWAGSAFDVYCNMTDGGGWTVFQRRVDGTVDFYLDWASYKAGFGNLTNEFWLGNDKLYSLTNQRSFQMRIDFVNANGAPYYAKYSSFRITNEADNYRLSVLGAFSGTANYDALDYHRDRPFSRKDRDNDASSYNCAMYYYGAWWYNKCHHSNLNGGYYSGGYTSVYWYNLPGSQFDIRYTEMKIRPA